MNQSEKEYELGMIGLGVMGRNLVLNMADKGYTVAGFDKDEEKVGSLNKEANNDRVFGAKNLKEFLNSLKKPRAVIKELLPHLEKDDIIIDGGNSHFIDTERHFAQLSKKGIEFIGVGVSGGEEGARHGPSMMPGGTKKAYGRVKEIFEAAAARVSGEPCVTYLGPKSAGHYVKMVHNGIEYGIMQLISETYHIFKEVMGVNDDNLHNIYKKWNEGRLQSYLVEITSHIFRQEDAKTSRRLVDVILDEAKQKGTGKWTSQDAMELQVPVPTIDAAVSMRDLSGYKEEREKAEKILKGPDHSFEGDKNEFIENMEGVLYFSMIATYAQGFALLSKASERYNFDLDLVAVARIWRGGCIIRSVLLDEFMKAFKKNLHLENLLLDDHFSDIMMKNQGKVREIVEKASGWGIPIPGIMATLGYYDAYRRAWLPANLIQAQRDFFGSHTYERIDEKGTFHTQWNEE
jgi:6-phosphogluconate dehydrogenase